MAEKDRIYGNYMVGHRRALCVEDNRERVEVHFADEFTVLFRHSFDALKPVPIPAGQGKDTQ